MPCQLKWHEQSDWLGFGYSAPFGAEKARRDALIWAWSVTQFCASL